MAERCIHQTEGLYNPQYEHDSCGVGFIVRLDGEKSHKIIRDGIVALNNLSHRGACGCEVNTGDGAGVLIQLPDEFFRKVCPSRGIDLPERGRYGAGILFMPKDASAAAGKALFERIVAEEGQRFLGWRPVPTDHRDLGASALAVEPAMEQAFVACGESMDDPDRFERKLYVIRRRFENEVATFPSPSTLNANGSTLNAFYFPSLSCYTLIYKGMLTP